MAAADAAVVALDVGTTGVRALVFDQAGVPTASAYREALPSHPAPGLVEHDLDDLWAATTTVLGQVSREANVPADTPLGLTTQRATAVVWDTETGRGVHRAISWQDGRTHDRCNELLGAGVFVVPLMAASKIEWILDRVDPDRARLGRGELRCGTLDAWLVWRLSGGRLFVTDHSNASSSGFYDLSHPTWQAAVSEALRVPVTALPTLVASSGELGAVGGTDGLPRFTLGAIAGDQQAATMGELCTEPGETKITYGTAAMIDVNVGTTPVWPTRGGYPLVLWKRGDEITYCIEGTAIAAGAAVTWLRDGLGIIDDPAASERLAASVPDSGGVWAVPAFQGLGTPYLDTEARAVIGGLSRGSTAAHVTRAILEGVAWRCREAFDALAADSPGRASALRADGRAARNDILLQAQADALGVPVERARVLDAAALGAAYLAGLATGVWTDLTALRAARSPERVFEPAIGADERETRFQAWRRHVSAARSVAA